MVKFFCDACKRELAKERSLNRFEYLCHMDDYSTGVLSGFADSDGNRVSGRTVSVDLCAACYNKIVIKAVAELKKLQQE